MGWGRSGAERYSAKRAPHPPARLGRPERSLVESEGQPPRAGGRRAGGGPERSGGRGGWPRRACAGVCGPPREPIRSPHATGRARPAQALAGPGMARQAPWMGPGPGRGGPDHTPCRAYARPSAEGGPPARIVRTAGNWPDRGRRMAELRDLSTPARALPNCSDAAETPSRRRLRTNADVERALVRATNWSRVKPLRIMAPQAELAPPSAFRQR